MTEFYTLKRYHGYEQIEEDEARWESLTPAEACWMVGITGLAIGIAYAMFRLALGAWHVVVFVRAWWGK